MSAADLDYTFARQWARVTSESHGTQRDISGPFARTMRAELHTILEALMGHSSNEGAAAIEAVRRLATLADDLAGDVPMQSEGDPHVPTR